MDPWWRSDLYTVSSLQPPSQVALDVAGPFGLAYVQVYPDGKTAPGWGEASFMSKYRARAFSSRRANVVYDRHQTPFALVMRSLRMVCVDIDGKNGGYTSAVAADLPPTMAETSKSGNGYHLFYLVDDTWDDDRGYAGMSDRVAFLPGIDIRGTGCVFHYPQQQWNNRAPAPMPEHIVQRLTERVSLGETVARIKEVLAVSTPEEVMVMQDSIASKLTAPIPAGKRNNTLFAIGAEMATAQVPNWEKQIYDRAIEVGLDQVEAEKLVKNIRRYG